MTKLLQTVMIFAVVIAVVGAFTVYSSGRTVDFAFADGHDGGGEPPPDDSYSEPPPDD